MEVIWNKKRSDDLYFSMKFRIFSAKTPPFSALYVGAVATEAHSRLSGRSLKTRASARTSPFSSPQQFFFSRTVLREQFAQWTFPASNLVISLIRAPCVAPSNLLLTLRLNEIREGFLETRIMAMLLCFLRNWKLA